MTKKYGPKSIRFVVYYEEDCDGGTTLTFGVTAPSAAEATAMVITYIRENALHDSAFGYSLIPRAYNINTKTKTHIIYVHSGIEHFIKVHS